MRRQDRNYFFQNPKEEPVQATDPTNCDWWEISFNPRSEPNAKDVLVEAYVPLAGEYRPMVACFDFQAVPNGYKIVFTHCQPS
jgi:hypothetical protein